MCVACGFQSFRAPLLMYNYSLQCRTTRYFASLCVYVHIDGKVSLICKEIAGLYYSTIPSIRRAAVNCILFVALRLNVLGARLTMPGLCVIFCLFFFQYLLIAEICFRCVLDIVQIFVCVCFTVDGGSQLFLHGVWLQVSFSSCSIGNLKHLAQCSTAIFAHSCVQCTFLNSGNKNWKGFCSIVACCIGIPE